ncbi:hypothetical protein [Spirosoma sp.]|uniref:hypothetical protein n=1 Tax=Spirosoma sp. TaxID=1899569 RepID=UPI00262C3ECA|nr:hypothetical protein [Spirosoma sp.]MCX6217675.1 hypothetical protein [Spirosoma sp.]
MATHAEFIEQNATAENAAGERYPVWAKETTLGKHKTQEYVSAWQLSEQEYQRVAETGMVFVRMVAGQPPMHVYWADACQFEGQSQEMKHPDCFDLPVYRQAATFNGQPTFTLTSAWKLREYGLKEVANNHGIVFVSTVGCMPEMEVFGINPID